MALDASNIRPRRSALYMPGANARALEKAKTLASDVLILDLEDAVAPDAKQTARDQIAEAVGQGGYANHEVVLRTNGSTTEWFADDIDLAARLAIDAVLVPKVASANDVAAIRTALVSAGARAELQVWAMIETPIAILNLGEIAEAAANPHHPLACFVLGTNDLVKETGVELDEARTAAQYWLMATVTAARAHGIDVLDAVYNNFKDMDGYALECAQGRAFGMDGKTLIHPSQIEGANATFSPSEAAVAAAREIIAAFEQPENAGKGVINLGGRMVERLHADMAARTVAKADAIAARAAARD